MYNFILLAQTRTGATLEIILMLAVAALIGFVSAYLYYRIQHRKALAEADARYQTKSREAEEALALNARLQNEVEALKDGILAKEQKLDKLQAELSACVEKCSGLEKQIAAGSDKKRPASQDKSLEKIRSQKHKIDFGSFGVASREQADDLTRIKGIGPWIQEKLYALDIFTFNQIARFTAKDIADVTGVIEFFPGRIERDKWVVQAKKLANAK